MAGIEDFKGFSAGFGSSVSAINWGGLFLNIMLGLVAAGLLVGAYIFYRKWAEIKYKVTMRYDTQNGYRYYNDYVIQKQHKDGSKYLWLIKTKALLPKLEMSRILYGKGKPLLDLYLDVGKEIHYTDFTAKKPVYDNKGKIIHYNPLVTPTQTNEGKKAYQEWVKGTYSEHEKAKNPYLVPSLLLGSALIGMVMIIVATKVAT